MKYHSNVLRNYTDPEVEVPEELFELISKIPDWERILYDLIDVREKLEDEIGGYSIKKDLLRGIQKGSDHFEYTCDIYTKKIELLSLEEIEKETRIKDDLTPTSKMVFERVLKNKVRTIMTRIIGDIEKYEVGLEGIIVLRKDVVGGELTRKILVKLLGKKKVSASTIEDGSLKIKVSAIGRKYPSFLDKLAKDPRSVLKSSEGKDTGPQRTTKKQKRTRSGPTRSGIEKVVSNIYAAFK